MCIISPVISLGLMKDTKQEGFHSDTANEKSMLTLFYSASAPADLSQKVGFATMTSRGRNVKKKKRLVETLTP